MIVLIVILCILASPVILGAASAGIGVVLLSLVDTSASGLALFRWKELALAVVILVLTRWVPVTKKLHPIVFIGAAAVVGVVFRF